MSPKDLVRAIVSAPKQLHNDEDSCLDLSYITPRIIVAAGPSDDVITNLFRSPVDKVINHLNQHFTFSDKRHWHIWNLRGEGPGYNIDKLKGCWTYHPFPDHLPPSIALLLMIVEEIDKFMSKSPMNVALIHCKEGKGRSGTICCAYLMYEAKKKGIYMSVEEAIAIFTRKRMRKIFGPGVSIKSQIRYLEYWKRFLQSSHKLQQNFALYNLADNVPFNTSLSMLTKVTIFKPTLFLLFSRMKLSTYTSKNDGLIKRELDGTTLKLPSYAGTSAYYEIALNKTIDCTVKDICISFERQICVAYAWFNLFYETVGPINRTLPYESGERTMFGRKVIKWEEFDGFRGSQNKSTAKLFDRLDVQWKFQY